MSLGKLFGLAVGVIMTLSLPFQCEGCLSDMFVDSCFFTRITECSLNGREMEKAMNQKVGGTDLCVDRKTYRHVMHLLGSELHECPWSYEDCDHKLSIFFYFTRDNSHSIRPEICVTSKEVPIQNTNVRYFKEPYVDLCVTVFASKVLYPAVSQYSKIKADLTRFPIAKLFNSTMVYKMKYESDEGIDESTTLSTETFVPNHKPQLEELLKERNHPLAKEGLPLDLSVFTRLLKYIEKENKKGNNNSPKTRENRMHRESSLNEDTLRSDMRTLERKLSKQIDELGADVYKADVQKDNEILKMVLEAGDRRMPDYYMFVCMVCTCTIQVSLTVVALLSFYPYCTKIITENRTVQLSSSKCNCCECNGGSKTHTDPSETQKSRKVQFISDREKIHGIIEMTPEQRYLLCKQLGKKEWIDVCMLSRCPFEICIDETITKEKAKCEIDNILVNLSMKHLVTEYKITQHRQAEFEFTTNVGDRQQSYLLNGDSGPGLSVGAFVVVPNKGVHYISAGHGKVCQKMIVNNAKGSLVGACVASEFSLFPKACDVVLVKPVECLDQTRALNVVYDRHGTAFHLRMHNGRKEDLLGCECHKFDAEFDRTRGVVQEVAFHFRENSRGGHKGSALGNCIAIVSADGVDEPFSGNGESGKMVVIKRKNDNTNVALGIIFGVYKIDSTTDRKLLYTLLTPIWRALRVLDMHPYAHHPGSQIRFHPG